MKHIATGAAIVFVLSGCALDGGAYDEGSFDPNAQAELQRQDAEGLIQRLGASAPVLASVEASTPCSETAQSDVTLDVLTVRVHWTPVDELVSLIGKSVVMHSMSHTHKQMWPSERHYAVVAITNLDPALHLDCEVDGGYLIVDQMNETLLQERTDRTATQLQNAVAQSYDDHGRPEPLESNEVSGYFLGD